MKILSSRKQREVRIYAPDGEISTRRLKLSAARHPGRPLPGTAKLPDPEHTDSARPWWLVTVTAIGMVLELFPGLPLMTSRFGDSGIAIQVLALVYTVQISVIIAITMSWLEMPRPARILVGSGAILPIPLILGTVLLVVAGIVVGVAVAIWVFIELTST